MSYTALYRKFRPVEFEDVKGQEHIITTLKNQIEANRIGHAYLFCGTRGTGKTTVAKIFAKAVNCEHPVNGSPCGECAMCRSIAAGTSMNVIEIDAASNNGVDNIREIREEVAYRPTEGKYKVYIIDEVHMLSIGAFNALLKTLEEPPEYVIFILATTEVHKIPITILSRCQHYDFKRISIETITDRMRDLMQEEQVEVEEKALRYVAKAADGSMRDALSLLDQCIAFYLGQKLTYDNVLEVLGAVDTDVFSRLLRSVIRRDVPIVLDIVDDLVMQGRELTQLATDFTWYLRNLLLVKTSDNIEVVLDVSTENMQQLTDFTWYLRNLLLVKTSDNIEVVLDVSTENMQQLQEEAGMVESDMLLRYIRIFSELSGQPASGRGRDGGIGYAAPLHSDFFGIVRSAEICSAKKSASGSGSDQALYACHGDELRFYSGSDPCIGRKAGTGRYIRCSGTSCLCKGRWSGTGGANAETGTSKRSTGRCAAGSKEFQTDCR